MAVSRGNARASACRECLRGCGCGGAQILADGELRRPLKIAAAQFSGAARSKIEAAGGTVVDVPQRVKWTKALGKERIAAKAAAEAANPKPVKAKKK